MQILGIELNKLPSNKSVYLIHGGETLQTIEAASAIRDQLKDRGFSERKILEVNNHFNWDTLIEASNTLSLFSTKQLIELHIKDDKIGQQGSKAILQFLDNSYKDVCLLIITGKLETSSQKSKWFSAIEFSGCIVAAKPIAAYQFNLWIIARLKRYDFIASAEIINLLARLYHDNLVAIAQLMETLAICLPKGELSLATISPYLHNNAEFNIFNLIDAAIDGDCQTVCQIFKHLQHNKTEPAIILWSIARELRILIKITFSLEQGKSYAAICKEQGIWTTRAEKIRKYLNDTSRKQLENQLQRLTYVDLIIKGITPGLIWESLLTVYLQFTNTPINRTVGLIAI